MKVTETLAQFIVDTKYENLPSAVVEAAKIAILDGVANIVAGSVQDLANIVGNYVKDVGGTPQSTMVGWNFKTHACLSNTGNNPIIFIVNFINFFPMNIINIFYIIKIFFGLFGHHIQSV